MASDRRTTGGCLCGAVRFVAEGEPYRVGLCHCLDCRKHGGAPFGAFAIFPAERVSFSGDTPATYASSAHGRRRFCRRSLGRSLVGVFLVSHLKLQPAFAGSFGEGLDPAMEQEAAAVEHDARHAGLLGPLGQRLADGGSAVAGRRGLALQLLVERRGGGQRLARRIVDDLGVDVPSRAVDRKPRLAGRAFAKRGAHAAAAAVEQ